MSLLKSLLSPAPLPYDFAEWQQKPFAERAKLVCQAWAMQGFGAPFATAVFYLLKIVLYVGMWVYFCSFSVELGSMAEIGQWGFHLEALQKAVLWTVLLEVVGLGGGSGPLTGRYVPPLGGMLYFLRPGTVKMPLFPGKPLIGSDQRSLLDVLLYAALLGGLVWALIAPAVTVERVWPLVVLLPLLGLLDRTIYLAARADVYYPMLVCMLFPLEMGAGLKLMWIGIWLWAAFSKLTPNFASVVCVMLCNSPFLSARIFNGFKRNLFRQFPEDLRPSRMAQTAAHFGTLVEFSMPLLLLLFFTDPTIVFFALCALTLFHLFIFLNFPMGVPLEWNVIMVYGGWLLFGAHPEISPFAISEPWLWGLFVVVLGVLPVLGHLYPRYISFLLSMRYYAGTWAYSIWLFKGDSLTKVDQHIPKTSRAVKSQLLLLYDESQADAILSRLLAFRMMHLPGRLLQDLLPQAVDDIEAYTWTEGETFAGEVLGWNFGDGHLHHRALLDSVQKRCQFAPGELRVIMVESPTFHRQELAWEIHDGHDGLLSSGIGRTADLTQQQPWPRSLVDRMV